MIIIAGDSWGVGETVDRDNLPDNFVYENYQPIGLHTYLEDSGYAVINCSVNGNSNFDSFYRLAETLQKLAIQNMLKDISHIFIFQTEWHRVFRRSEPVDLVPFIKRDEKEHYVPTNFNQDFLYQVISRWYYKLSDLAQEVNVRIGIIGGCSDTVWLENFEQEYPGLYIACQSLTNLCIHNNDKIDNPVFSFRIDPEFVELCKKYDIGFLMDQLDLSAKRKDEWSNHPEWFYPDNRHANRHAHYKLYEFLKTKLNLRETL